MKGYISQIINFQEVTLGNTQIESLTSIMRGSNNSAYKIASQIRSERPIAYKNIRKTLGRLRELKLIHIMEGDFPRKAKNYELTTYGLFYLLLKGDIGVLSTSVLEKYQDNIVFQDLVYPFFEKNTFLHGTLSLKIAIQGYLKRCCQETLIRLEMIRSIEDPDKKDWFIEQLGLELERNARMLVFEMMTRENEVNRNHWSIELIDRTENDTEEWSEEKWKFRDSVETIKVLSGDNKFVQLLKIVREQFEIGCQKILN
jgi:hypothetical protein